MVTGIRRGATSALAVLALSVAAACQSSTAEAPVAISTAAPSTAPPAEVLAHTTCASTTLDALDREQRVGQLLVVGVDVRDATRAVPWVGRYHLGGVLLTGTTELTVAEARELTDALHEGASDDGAGADAPRPLVAVDQEGGARQTLRGTEFYDIPSAAVQGTWDAETTTRRTELWAGVLHRAGVDLTLAPVADTVLTDVVEDNLVIGSNERALGTDTQAVAVKVDQIVKGIQSQQVIATVRDFPGVGRLLQDPATSTSVSDEQLTIDDPQIAPFVTGIEAGADVVLVSTATYPQLSPATPAVYSEDVITGLLRDVVGFTGVVISDDLSDTLAAATHPVAERGVRFVQAGGDLVVSANSSASREILDGMLAEDASNAEFSQLVDAAALRVLTLKAEHGVLTCD